MASVSPEQARAYRRRWELVDERQRAEQAASTIEQRFDELERLMLSLRDFGWKAALDDDAPVRARWAKLRKNIRPARMP